MGQLPDFLQSGEAARLFPVLADTSKEGRTLSIFLACLENVNEFGRSMLGSVGLKLGSRARIDTFTEVVFKKGVSDSKHRPDGLIKVSTGKSTWTALVEAKVGTAELTNNQIEAYLGIAKSNAIDAVITVSNQFTALPTHHPLSVSSLLTRKVSLFHWSWGYVITQAQLLRELGEVDDREQLILLSELQRFLLHPSSGVKEFDQMPAAWSDLCANIAAGGTASAKNPICHDVVGSWHQALDRLTGVLSRQIGNHVKLVMSKSDAIDPTQRQKTALAELVSGNCVQSEVLIPDAAAPVQICADFGKRALSFHMRLKAPADRKSTKARLSWLTRQLSDTDNNDLHVRLFWPGRSPTTQYPLKALLADPDIAILDRPGMVVHSFEILLVRDLGAKFAQRKIIVTELLNSASAFYDLVGAKVSAWQPKPPKISEGKREPASVSTEAMRDQVEREALDRSG
ncbi:hypothetical protein BSY18_1790 [Blastomonas sp. RAC04]|uniref:hypothetical protein n=1 Tax=Blastomonas sp. RAC04 TaxID=1842535 RepID=UPI0008577F3D|nr:hypothetical protein [Blastomonas sp. RAC04]AOF99815.1 hypothetical protein BSY18_1790 [Blastomonas sp. RAC04]